jgi:uncharacterized LabA/DUF88 family protein
MLSAQGPLFGAALALFKAIMRTSIYVDGFNLYYGALKGTPFKWLDLKQLCTLLLPNTCVIDKIKYFTARVSGATDPDAPRRQRIFLNALQTTPEVEIHYGNFLSKSIWRPLVNLPIAGATIHSSPIVQLPAGNHHVSGNPPKTLPVGSYPRRGQQRRGPLSAPPAGALVAEVHTMEEKGSDVNLAAHLLNDAWKNSFDVAAVISNDTDLVTPIRMVTQERGKAVYIVCPGRWNASPKLVNVSSYVRHIHSSMLRQAQLPDPIPGTTIRKPPGW